MSLLRQVGAHVVELMLDALETSRIGLERAALELLAEQNGIEPHEFTVLLRSLIESRVLQPPYEVSGTLNRRLTHVYSARALDDDDLALWHERIRDREKLLPAPEQRRAGEQYIRALLGRAKREGATWLRRIPQKARLGNFAISCARSADLIVGINIPGVHHQDLLIESKNLRERIDVSNPILPKLMESALDEGKLPVLFAAHMAPRAETFCRRIGIVVVHLGKRIVCKSKKKEVHRLWPGTNEFHFARLTRILTEPIHPLTRYHIDIVKGVQAIRVADMQWRNNGECLRWAIDSLRSKRWGQTMNHYLSSPTGCSCSSSKALPLRSLGCRLAVAA